MLLDNLPNTNRKRSPHNVNVRERFNHNNKLANNCNVSITQKLSNQKLFCPQAKVQNLFCIPQSPWLMRYVNILLKVKLQTCYLTTFAKNISYLNMRVMPQARIFHFPPHTFHCFWWLTLFALPNNGHTVLLLKMFNVNVKRLFIGEKSTLHFQAAYESWQHLVQIMSVWFKSRCRRIGIFLECCLLTLTQSESLFFFAQCNVKVNHGAGFFAPSHIWL